MFIKLIHYYLNCEAKAKIEICKAIFKKYCNKKKLKYNNSLQGVTCTKDKSV